MDKDELIQIATGRVNEMTYGIADVDDIVRGRLIAAYLDGYAAGHKDATSHAVQVLLEGDEALASRRADV